MLQGTIIVESVLLSLTGGALGLLFAAAIILWNTVYLERAIQAIKDHGATVDENLLEHLLECPANRAEIWHQRRTNKE